MSRAGILPETPRESCRLGSSGALPRVRVHAPPRPPSPRPQRGTFGLSLPLALAAAVTALCSAPRCLQTSDRISKAKPRQRAFEGANLFFAGAVHTEAVLPLCPAGSWPPRAGVEQPGEEWRVSSRFEAGRLHKPWRPRCPRRFTLSCLPHCPVRLLGVKRNGVDSGELGCGVRPVDVREAWVLC